MVINGYVLSMDPQRTVYPAGAVAVSGNRILAVGREREVRSSFRPRLVLDAGGGIVHPGYVEAHTHVTLQTTRGAFPEGADPQTLYAWYARWFNHLEDEDEFASTKLACVEMLHAGITCYLDAGASFEPEAVAAATGAVGMRGSVGEPFLWDLGEFKMAAGITRTPADRERSLRLLGSQLWRNRDPDALVRGHVALYGLGTASDELVLAAKACADENGAIFTQHQSLEQEDAAADDARFGRHPLVHYAELGALGENCTFSHMNVLRDDELGVIAESGMSVAWHPGFFIKNGIGHGAGSRMTDLHRLGVNLGLGTDVAGSWGFGDQGWLGYLLAREWGGALSVGELLEMSTLGGAQAMGLAASIGSLEPGKKADLVIRSTHHPEAQPALDRVHELVLVTRTKGVDTVIVDGRVVMRHGALVNVDEAAVYAAAHESARSLVKRADIPAGAAWPIQE